MIQPAKNILRTYLNRLTNLAGNNRSILFLKLLSGQTIDLCAFNFLNKETSFGIIEALMAGKTKHLCPVIDSRLEASNELSTKIKRLQRINKFIFEEQGSTDLHVAWPFVRGKFSDGTSVRAPLLFFPVSLIQSNNAWIIEPRKDAGISFNKSFLLAYSFFNKLPLEEELLDHNFEDASSDSTIFRTELYTLLKEKLAVNFNPDNFRQELIKFQEFKKEAFDESHRNGEIKLYPEAVLGIFPQAGSQLVPDYLHLIEAENFTDLEDFFIRHAQSPRPNQPIREERLYTPFTLDAWQEEAIKTIKAGKSVVVQGPPGTGKSQLICNLMADAIASGKRALLVCQKRAALDVVYNRLCEIELGDFLGLVHDFRNDRREIFDKIDRQVELIEDYKTRNRSIDVIQMERKFFQVSRRIDQICEELEDFRKALYNDEECGITVKELYLTSDINADTVNIKQEFQYFNFQHIDVFLRKLKKYSLFADQFDREDYMLCKRKSFAGLGIGDLKNIVETINDIAAYQELIATRISEYIPIQLNLEDCESFRAREDDILGMMSVLKEEETYAFMQQMVGERDHETSLLWISNIERVMMSCYAEDGPEKTLTADNLGKFQVVLQKRMDARRNLWRRARWDFFSEHKFWVKRVLVLNNLNYNKRGLRTLERRLDSRLNFEHHVTSLRSKEWLTDMPVSYEIADWQVWFKRTKMAIRAKIVFNSIREVKEGINVSKYSRTQFIQLFHNLINSVKDIPDTKSEWSKHLIPYQIRQLVLKPAITEQYIKILKRDFDNLSEYDKLKDSLTKPERDVITKLHDHVNQWNYEALEEIFQNSLRLAWIDSIEMKYPILRIVSSYTMGELQSELRQSIREKQGISQEIVMMRARERVCEDLQYNRLSNRITYRDLHHQATKKKKIWPLRKIIHEFQDELFKLIPCWMASPESVSALFPMNEVFDLVIFDEASQCFAERGIPAMYRGKQVLVAGDSQQLKPHELYQVRWDDEGEEPELEIDSLLNLSERYLPTVQLEGHYRSSSAELIHFSNVHFYGGKLKLLPNKSILNKQEPAIQFTKIEGRWEKNVNTIEAIAVVEKVFELIKEFPTKEIGVITFNAPQQMLILDLLEEKSATSTTSIPSTLFVKNIENVQGDEKDIILFSIGYAPDKKGKVMMQFGSLNVRGGENRLNVAITRAREQVIIMSSLWPEQLNVSESKNEGPKLLRSYLDFARSVHNKEFVPVQHQQTQRPASWYLKTKLKELGEQRIPEVKFDIDRLPFSDICFSLGGNYLGIILTDDERYIESISVKDIHAYTQELLSLKGWGHQMLFSRNFWINREKIESDMLLLIGTQKEYFVQ